MNSYISLYRKYRPKTFDEVVGQKVTISILKNSIKLNKIGHAYIFSGPRGTGKTSVAKIFSRAVNCLNNKNGDVCEECDNCKRKIEDEIDIIEIDAASNNGVDEIREIRNNVRLLPSNLKYKIYIVDEVHMLTDSAFNALLKTLEEPPSHVIFILATTEINKIPATVLSRCQKFNFKKLNEEEIVDRLKYICEKENADKKVNDESLKLIADLSDGGLRDAINLLDQALSLNDDISKNVIYDLIGSVDEDYLFDIISNIVDSNYKDLVKSINYLFDSGKNIPIILNNLQNIIENIIIYNSADKFFEKEYEEKLRRYTKIDLSKLIELSKQMFDLIYNLKKSNNQKILLEIYFLKMSFLFNSNEKEKIVINVNSQNTATFDENNIEYHEDDENNVSSEEKNILINNCLCFAEKKYKLDFINKYDKINEYITDKKYNSVANLLLKATPEVVSNKNIIFTFEKEFDLILFNKNIDTIEKFLKLLYNIKYDIVGILSEEWKKIREDYIKNINLGIKYEYIELEKKIKRNSKDNSVERKIENIFGDVKITDN